MPNLISYDPAFAFEIAVIIEDGIRRMYKDGESIFYYITVMNEQYEMPPMPDGAREGILKGLYRLRAVGEEESQGARAAARQRRDPQRGAQGAADPRGDSTTFAADVWSVTSYQELYRDGHAVERWNRLHPGEKPRVPYVDAVPRQRRRAHRRGVRLRQGAARRHRSLDWPAPDVARHRWIRPQRGRARLRDFFEVDAKHIVLATLERSARDGKIEPVGRQKAIKDLGINPEKPNPAIS